MACTTYIIRMFLWVAFIDELVVDPLYYSSYEGKGGGREGGKDKYYLLLKQLKKERTITTRRELYIM